MGLALVFTGRSRGNQPLVALNGTIYFTPFTGSQRQCFKLLFSLSPLYFSPVLHVSYVLVSPAKKFFNINRVRGLK